MTAAVIFTAVLLLAAAVGVWINHLPADVDGCTSEEEL